MRSDAVNFAKGCLTTAIIAAIIFAVAACVRTFVPSGRPGCPSATVWSDSAQRCIAREGR